LNEQDEHGDQERRRREEKMKLAEGATFPPFFSLSFFFLFSPLLPPFSPLSERSKSLPPA
jgi:hypothetical protein